MLFISVYVDDKLMFTDDKAWKDSLKAFLVSRFQIKDLGPAKLCLGLKITRDRKRGKVWIDQQKYIEDTLEKFNMNDCNPVRTPADSNQKLNSSVSPTSKDEKQRMRNIPYMKAVGRLVYMALTAASQEALWWRQLQAELQPQLAHLPTTLKMDNRGTQLLATNTVHHSRTKHIDVRHHFI